MNQNAQKNLNLSFKKIIFNKVIIFIKRNYSDLSSYVFNVPYVQTEYSYQINAID